MKSHHSTLTWPCLLQGLGWPLLFLALGSGLLHLGARWNVLPPPRAVWDMDRTVLACKADLSRSSIETDVVFLGDSSCMMNVDTKRFQQAAQRATFNLGALSFLGLPSFARLLELHVEAASREPIHVLLLLHPDFLRRSSPSAAHEDWLNHYLTGRDFAYRTGWSKTLSMALGIHIMEGRLLTWLPRPLSGAFRDFYGFTDDLEDYLKEHQGTAIDPRTLKPEDLQGSNEYRISNNNLRGAARFREMLPEGCILWVGFTPVPKSFVGERTEEQLRRLLNQWSDEVGAGVALNGLPVILPDSDFASGTHLNAEAAVRYTDLLVNAFLTTPLEETR